MSEYDLYGGIPPHQRHSKTSRDAALRVRVRLNRQHRSVVNVLLSGPKTDKEMQAILEWSGDTQRPRRIELVEMGQVRDSGTVRDRSTVWELVR